MPQCFAELSSYMSCGPNRWYNIGGDVLGVGCWNGGHIRNFPPLPFLGDPPVNCRGRIGRCGMVAFLQQLRPQHSSYGPNRWYNIGGAVLGVGHWNRGYIRNFRLLPFGVPIAPTVLRVGGPNHRKFGVVIVQKYGGLKTPGVEIWAKIWDILPPVKKRGNIDRMSMDILGVVQGAPLLV